jgi:hypothetical protein
MSSEEFNKNFYSEHLKDFLGAVFPGAFLLFCLIFIFFGPIIILDLVLKHASYNLSQWTNVISAFTQNITILGSFSTLIMFLIFSFVFGSIYYRRTCDLPTQKSILKLLTKDYIFLSLIDRYHRYYNKNRMRKRIAKYLSENRSKVRLIDSYIRNKYGIDGLKDVGIIKVEKLKIKNNFFRIIVHPIKFICAKKYYYKHFNYCNARCKINMPISSFHSKNISLFRYTEQYILGKKKVNIKYPFCCISKYLESNGYCELNKKISCPNDNLKRNYINEIKIKYKDNTKKVYELDKIEAHIRYSSSMWYVSRSITKLAYIMFSFFSVSLLVLFLIYKDLKSITGPLYANLYLVSFLAIMYIGCYFVCFRVLNYIENYIHKQRLTENIIAIEVL